MHEAAFLENQGNTDGAWGIVYRNSSEQAFSGLSLQDLQDKWAPRASPSSSSILVIRATKDASRFPASLSVSAARGGR